MGRRQAEQRRLEQLLKGRIRISRKAIDGSRNCRCGHVPLQWGKKQCDSLFPET